MISVKFACCPVYIYVQHYFFIFEPMYAPENLLSRPPLLHLRTLYWLYKRIVRCLWFFFFCRCRHITVIPSKLPYGYLRITRGFACFSRLYALCGYGNSPLCCTTHIQDISYFFILQTRKCRICTLDTGKWINKFNKK